MTCSQPVGLYLHIPFCIAKCPYCDFYSLPGDDAAMDSYVHALIRAMKNHLFGNLRADTLYLGGGTPSLLGPKRLARLLEAAREQFGLVGGEITLEANPGTLTLPVLRELVEMGFNRISLGVQSLDDRELAALGRRHTAREAVAALEQTHKAGFRRISADIMLGIPRQTRDSLAAGIRQLLTLPVEHISAYLLKVEHGTLFGEQEKKLALPGEDDVAQLYLDCVAGLKAGGLIQYEISNFARTGGQSRHNLKYWLCQEYLGLGPAAHSFIAGRRFFFPRELERFSLADNPFSLARQDGAGGDAEEFAMLRLRLCQGLNLADYARLGGNTAALRKNAAPLEQRGLVRIDGDNISLTPQGFLLSNAVTVALLD